MKKCKVIAFANQKGGTGKIPTVVSLATELTRQGFRVLAIDGDPQGNLTMSQGVFQPEDLQHTLSDLVYHYVKKKKLPNFYEECIRHDKDFYYIPSDVLLSGFD